MTALPKVTVVVVTLNNQKTIEKCGQSISVQDYPKDLVEYLNIDGGSTDATKDILKNYGFRTIDSPMKGNAEAQRAIGLKRAKNNLIVSLDADNYLPGRDWLRKMVQPFLDDPQIIYAGTLRYTYRNSDLLLNRYCSLFGVLDPIVYYIGRPDRIPHNVKHWSLGEIVRETPGYYTVEFSKETLPTVGCNGVIYKRDILLKFAKSSPSQFLHIDVFVDLLEKGYNRFAIVKNDVVHDTAVSLHMLIKKRIAFLSSYYLKTNIKRRYLIYDPSKLKDNLKLLLFIFYTVTSIKPLIDSLRGYLVVKDYVWFVHPFICWIYLYAYSLAVMRRVFIKRTKSL